MGVFVILEDRIAKMIKFKTEKQVTEVSTPDYIKCDMCHCEWSYNSGDIGTDIEIQEFININTVGGYGSIFGDGQRIKVDICQHCFMSIVKEHNIKLTDENLWFKS